VTADTGTDPAAFDEYEHSYDAALQRGLRLTGESKEYYAERRLRWLRQYLDRAGFRPRNVLDYGCGTGSGTALARSILSAAHVTGVDTSAGLLAAATRTFSGDVSFRHVRDVPDSPVFDLAVCNGVFHHIPPAGRPAVVAYILTRLRRGGILALWENNPWNLGTRLVMRRIPFDHDAQLLSPLEADRLLSSGGFTIRRHAFLFYFPRVLALARPLERFLTRVPLGGQYCIVASR
jgi:SAM-dependent methyltransferase